jgi:hypothetical protein
VTAVVRLTVKSVQKWLAGGLVALVVAAIALAVAAGLAPAGTGGGEACRTAFSTPSNCPKAASQSGGSPLGRSCRTRPSRSWSLARLRMPSCGIIGGRWCRCHWRWCRANPVQVQS